MDWSNEFYVRLYTRDTTTWRRLGWHGQNVLMQLLRKVDRAGTIELGGVEPWEAVVLHCNAPEDDARRGIAKMLELGVITRRGDLLVFPNFIEAQEACKSDKLRAKESRMRKARGDASQNVTAPSREVTPASQVDQPRHDASHDVTPRHSSLHFTSLPSLHSASLRTDPRARHEPPDVPLESVAADLVADNPCQSESELDRSAREHDELRRAVRFGFSARWEHAKQKGMWTLAGDPAVDKVALWVASLSRDRGEQLAALDRALDTFFADTWCRNAHFPIADLAKRPLRYLDPREQSPPIATGMRPGRLTPTRGTTAKDFEHHPDEEEQLAALEAHWGKNAKA